MNHLDSNAYTEFISFCYLYKKDKVAKKVWIKIEFYKTEFEKSSLEVLLTELNYLI